MNNMERTTMLTELACRAFSNIRVIVVTGVIAMVVGGCDDSHDVSCPEGEPVFESMTLTPDTVAPSADVDVVVVVSNFELSGEAGSHTEGLNPTPQDAADSDATACPGGHVHVYLDDLMTNPLIQAVESEFTITIPQDTAPGAHIIIGRLQNRDHSILTPEVTLEVNLTVE